LVSLVAALSECLKKKKKDQKQTGRLTQSKKYSVATSLKELETDEPHDLCNMNKLLQNLLTSI
jgi:hypothetical protein